MMLEFLFQNTDVALYVALLLASVSLLVIYVFRLHNFKLITQYASWQIEAQEIEEATHDAITIDANGNYPRISIVVPVNEQSVGIQSLLNNLFRQNYKGYYEVVLADESHSPELHDLFEEQTKRNVNVRYTFVPNTSRYIELRKLAITLGIKASRGEWVIVVNPETSPISDNWLQCYAQNLGEDVNFAEAYYNYDDDGSLVARRAIFERIDKFSTRLNAWKNGIVVACNTANWAVRKKWFVEQGGFADSLNITFGEEAIFANHKVNAENYVMLCSPETRLVEELATKHELSVNRMHSVEVMHHLSRSAKRKMFVSGAVTFTSYLFVLCLLFYTSMRIFCDVEAYQYSVSYVYTDILALTLWILGLSLPISIVRTALRTLNERKYGFYIYVYEMLRPFHALSAKLKYRIHKEEFVRKYI